MLTFEYSNTQLFALPTLVCTPKLCLYTAENSDPASFPMTVHQSLRKQFLHYYASLLSVAY